MSSWRQQALIESPVRAVWELVGDPNRYPEWASDVVEVTGLPTAESEATFQQVTEAPDGTHVVDFQIERLDEEVRTIHLRCIDSRTYLRCALTEARGHTFVDMETGTDKGDRKAADDEQTRKFFIGLADKMLNGLRRSAG